MFRDTSDYNSRILYPSNLTEIKRLQMPTNLRASNLYSIEIVSGMIDDDYVFVVDQNNNKDLTDDSIRVMEDYEWNSSEKSIRCLIELPHDDIVTIDTSWIKLGKQGESLLLAKDEHLIVELLLDYQDYTLGVIDQMFQSTFTYGARPEIAILSKPNFSKDSLKQVDLLQKGEFLKLADQYYRFDSISTYGEFIWLIKEANFDSKTGIQVGMLAPQFIATTTKGEKIISDDLHDKPLLIANTCACGGDTQSANAYYAVRTSFKDDLNTIRIDSNIKDKRTGTHIDTETEENSDIYHKYRNAYCSRIAFLISSSNRIVDKFPITDWEIHVPKYLNTQNE